MNVWYLIILHAGEVATAQVGPFYDVQACEAARAAVSVEAKRLPVWTHPRMVCVASGDAWGSL